MSESSSFPGLLRQRGKDTGYKNFPTKNVRNSRPTKGFLKKKKKKNNEKSDRNTQRSMFDIKTPCDLISMFSNSGEVALMFYML